MPDSANNQQSSNQKNRRSTSSIKEKDTQIEEIVKEVLNDMINLIENSDCTDCALDPPQKRILNETENDDDNDKFLIEQCLTYLKKLCHTFITKHLFCTNEQTIGQDQIDKSFKSLFNVNIRNDDGYQVDSNEPNNLTLVNLKPNCLSYLQSFQILNKLLIKMLFFPREQHETSLDLCFNKSDSTSESLEDSFEEWLKDLFVISSTSCLNQLKSLFEFQSITLNTLIELIQLSESVNSHFSQQSQCQSQSDPKCLLQSIFTKRQIEFIFNQSKFGYLTARMLWSHLAPHSNSQNESSTDKRASILFCLLHELLPNNLCEEIIINNLLNQSNTCFNNDTYLTSNLNLKIDAFKRFTRLWHWSRELNSNSDSRIDDNFLNNDEFSVSTIKYGKLTKTFERCLLILLDMLGKEETPRSLSKLIQEWIVNCITDYNDLARLVDILLVSLMHPSTARVSIQYFLNNILNSTNKFYLNEEENENCSSSSSENSLNYESKVYAISNEGGNVKYHVNESMTNKSINSTHNNSSQQMFMLTSLDQSLNNTKPLRNANVELPLSILNAASLSNQGISLRINPLLVLKNNPTSETEDIEEIGESDQNARLLENYKAAIKARELKEQLSPVPAIKLEQNNNRLSLETNQSDLDDDMDEEDEDNEDLDDEQDENDFDPGFLNSEEEYTEEDNQSQTTDITLLSSQAPKSPSLFKKQPKKSPKQKVKKDKKKYSKNNSSTSTLNKSPKLSESKQTTSDEHLKAPKAACIQKPCFKELTVDLQNPIDPNYSYMLVYINCNNIQTSLHSNQLLVSSSFSNSSYDHVRTLFILKCIEQLLEKCTKEFLISISSTNITNNQKVFSVHNEKLLDLLLRHLKSIYGENFYSNNTSNSLFNFNLNSTSYLEAITLILLFYVRSYYPPFKFVVKTTSCSGEDLKFPKSASINSIQSIANDLVLDDSNLYVENRNVQIYSLKILSKLFKELNLCISQTTTNSLVLYSNCSIQKSILDYLDKLRIQKTFLHLFYSTIHQPAQNTITNLIIQSSNKQIQYSYITELMSCLENLIELERSLNDFQQTAKYLKIGIPSNPALPRLNIDSDCDDFLLTFNQSNSKKLSTGFTNSLQLPNTQSTKYIATQSIFNQSMFISSILYYLKNMSLVEYHLDIMRLIRNTLSSAGASLKSIGTYLIEQLCRNLVYITDGGMNSSGGSSSGNYIQPIIAYMSHVSTSINIPDLLINMLKQLSFMLNYCLVTSSSSNTICINLNNDINTETQCKLFRQFQIDNELNLLQAKESLIHLFPSIIRNMAQVWQRCNLLLNSQTIYQNISLDPPHFHQQTQHYSWILGHPFVIKQCITDLLNPIAQNHSIQFMIAIGTVWGEKRKSLACIKSIMF